MPCHTGNVSLLHLHTHSTLVPVCCFFLSLAMAVSLIEESPSHPDSGRHNLEQGKGTQQQVLDQPSGHLNCRPCTSSA